MSALVDAIRKKHKTAKSALRALGVDESLLDPPATRMRKRDIRLRKHLDEMISLVDLLGTDENSVDVCGRENKRTRRPVRSAWPRRLRRNYRRLRSAGHAARNERCRS